jgi:hypothetical protein
MEVEADDDARESLRDGDVLVYMSGRLLVVDHLVPEAFTIDLVELSESSSSDPAVRSEMLRSHR